MLSTVKISLILLMKSAIGNSFISILGREHLYRVKLLEPDRSWCFNRVSEVSQVSKEIVGSQRSLYDSQFIRKKTHKYFSSPTFLGQKCCKEKIVGGETYSLLGEEDTSSFSCMDRCTYSKDKDPNSKFCFAPGTLKTECKSSPSSFPSATSALPPGIIQSWLQLLDPIFSFFPVFLTTSSTFPPSFWCSCYLKNIIVNPISTVVLA